MGELPQETYFLLHKGFVLGTLTCHQSQEWLLFSQFEEPESKVLFASLLRLKSFKLLPLLKVV